MKLSKKIDFRMSEELSIKLDYLSCKLDIKRSSYCRRAVEVRVEEEYKKLKEIEEQKDEN